MESHNFMRRPLELTTKDIATENNNPLLAWHLQSNAGSASNHQRPTTQDQLSESLDGSRDIRMSIEDSDPPFLQCIKYGANK